MSASLKPLDSEEQRAFIDLLCIFASACGREAAEELLPREAPDFNDPRCTLAWQEGYDSVSKLAN